MTAPDPPPTVMYPDFRKTAVSADAVRPMSSSPPLTDEPTDWRRDMEGVARRRDRECFMRIYDHFMPRLCVYQRGLGAPDATAEDLAQESLLRLWQHADRFDPAQSALSTWLYRISRNLFIDRVRHEQSWAQAQSAVEGAAADDPPDTSSAESFAEHSRLRQRIRELPAVQARLVRMSYFEARSHSEIADALGMPLGTVKSHLRRAFLQLQSTLGGDA